VVEVTFDVPAPEVDEDRRGGDETEGGRGGAERAGAERQGRRHRRNRDDAGLERAVSQALAGSEREGGDADRLQPQEREDAAVPPAPPLIRELRALGEGGPQGPGELDKGHESAIRAASVPLSNRALEEALPPAGRHEGVTGRGPRYCFCRNSSCVSGGLSLIRFTSARPTPVPSNSVDECRRWKTPNSFAASRGSKPTPLSRTRYTSRSPSRSPLTSTTARSRPPEYFSPGSWLLSPSPRPKGQLPVG